MRLIIKGCEHIDDKQHRIEIDTYPEDVNFHEEYFAISGYFGKHGPHVFAAAPDLLEALEAYQTAQAMPEYGDYSGFEVAKRTMRYEGKPEWGHICEKHGLGYDGRCLCCEDDFKRHRADNDRKARNARDDALRDAARKAAAAIAKAKGEQ